MDGYGDLYNFLLESENSEDSENKDEQIQNEDSSKDWKLRSLPASSLESYDSHDQSLNVPLPFPSFIKNSENRQDFNHSSKPQIFDPNTIQLSDPEPIITHDYPEVITQQGPPHIPAEQDIGEERRIQATLEHDGRDEEVPEVRELHAHLHRPFRLIILWGMALLNSPRRAVTTKEVYHFAIHHFKHYRTEEHQLLKSLYTVPKQQPSRILVGQKKQNGTQFFLKKNCAHPKTWLIRREREYMRDVDPRGEEFYNRIFSGDVGLPRQLFYQIFGQKSLKHLTGPENSAMFYHLLGTKMDPKLCLPAFREHNSTENSKHEPKFEEEHLDYDVRALVEYWPSYGAALGAHDATRVMSGEEASLFHDNIDAYFGLQKEYKAKGYRNWTTPKICDVKKHVFLYPS